MSDDIQQYLTEIESAAQRYQSATNEANQVISEVDRRLKLLDGEVGLQHPWIFSATGKDGTTTSYRFGILRPFGRDYCLSFTKVIDGENSGWRPMTEAPRVVRIASQNVIASLLKSLLDEVQRTADEVEAAKTAIDGER